MTSFCLEDNDLACCILDLVTFQWQEHKSLITSVQESLKDTLHDKPQKNLKL